MIIKYSHFKRGIDFLFSLVSLILSLPLMVISAFLIYIVMGTPVFFVQKRIGKNNKEFKLYKFRSMQKKSDKHQTDNERITRLGNFLRDFRLDELPQLFNILNGDMSFIGPRPLLPEYLPFYSEEEIKRHKIRPGLSGLSQVNHLHYPDWETQFKDDVVYAETISFGTDIIILLKTLQKMLHPSSMKLTNIKPRPTFIEYRKGQRTSH
jgi:lipopolysaccharide/colanic/teichoic acid biosynthesis glycosyltransferase